MAVAGQVLVVLGALMFLVAATGLLSLPDCYSRASAVTLAAEAGTTLVLTGALLVVPSVPAVIKVVGAITLQVAGCAVASMMVARSAYLTGTPLTGHTRRDELADDAGTGALPGRTDPPPPA